MLKDRLPYLVGEPDLCLIFGDGKCTFPALAFGAWLGDKHTLEVEAEWFDFREADSRKCTIAMLSVSKRRETVLVWLGMHDDLYLSSFRLPLKFFPILQCLLKASETAWSGLIH